MSSLYNGFVLKEMEKIYGKVLNAAIEVLSEYAVNNLLG